MKNRIYFGAVLGLLGIAAPLPAAPRDPGRDRQGLDSVASAQSLESMMTAPPAAGRELEIAPRSAADPLPAPEFASSLPLEGIEIGPLQDVREPAPFDGAFHDALEAHVTEPEGIHEIYSTGSMFRRGRWYVQQDGVVLIRSFMKDRAIARAYDADTPTFHSLNLSSAPLRYQPGMRASIGRVLGIDTANRQHSIEFGFLGLFDWDNSHTFRNVNFTQAGGAVLTNRVSTVLGGDPMTIDTRLGLRNAGSSTGPLVIQVPGFTTTDTHSINYAADFNNYEVNYRLHGRPPRDRAALQPDGVWVRFASSSHIKSAFAGLRMTTMNESFLYTSRGTGTGLDGADVGLYEVRLNNRLLGVQFGGDILERHHNWYIGLRGKLGGLVNFARRNSLYSGTEGISTTVNGAITTRSSSLQEESHDEHLTFLAETGAFAAYDLSPSASIRVSYDAIYLSGLAMATPNISLGNTFGPFNIENGLLLHGLSIGYEAMW